MQGLMRTLGQPEDDPKEVRAPSKQVPPGESRGAPGNRTKQARKDLVFVNPPREERAWTV